MNERLVIVPTYNEIENIEKIIDAARACLLADGYAAMSTRKVAEKAGVPLSQIHYHFGSKDDLILGLLRADPDKLTFWIWR